MRKALGTVVLVAAALAATACDDRTRGTCGYQEDGKPAAVEAPIPGDTKRYQDNGDGTVTDRTTGLVWEQGYLASQEAAAGQKHCDELTLAGAKWVLPTIDQLRTLVTGCKDTGTGGDCNVTLACLADCAACQERCTDCKENCEECGGCRACNTDCYDVACYGCTTCLGPGRYGCYMDSIFQQPCGYYMSGTTLDIYDAFFNPIPHTYGVHFVDGYVFIHTQNSDGIPNLFDVRCVKK